MCNYPRLAVVLGEIDGKKKIKFLPRFRLDWSYESAKRKYGDSLLCLPCGKCPSCTLAYSKQWSVRLMLESLYHEEMSFITLTYDNDHLPADRKVNKRDVQLFLKRLRAEFPEKSIRYFGCGEYGDLTHRPHYHLIIFGHSFDYDSIASTNELGQKCYSSKQLQKLWTAGLSSTGEVTPESCSYVARYSMKKKFGVTKDDSFLMMSSHPGIGFQFYLDKKDILYLSDRVYSSQFHGVSIPRYFDKLASEDPIVSDMFEVAKQKRLQRGQQQLYSKMIQYGKDSIEATQVFELNEIARRGRLPKRGF